MTAPKNSELRSSAISSVLACTRSNGGGVGHCRNLSPRTVTVDVSGLTGYDNAGRKLLRYMYGHGTKIAAANASSLLFLGEITATPKRGPAPALVRESVMTPDRANRPEPMRKAAAGRRL